MFEYEISTKNDETFRGILAAETLPDALEELLHFYQHYQITSITIEEENGQISYSEEAINDLRL